MKRIETMVGRPLIHVVCLLHTLELFFKKLFYGEDGGTSGKIDVYSHFALFAKNANSVNVS